MRDFEQYQHIERLGTTETDGIEMGMCYVFPKIDGTNSQLWLDDDGFVCCGSRRRVLSSDSDNAGFYKWAVEQRNIKKFFGSHPTLRLYGEWLVPHTLKTYTEDAWRCFYVFDVMDDNRYLAYDEYQPLMEEFNIEYIPPICKVKNPTTERLIAQLEKNTFLIKDGEGTGEGVVVKNYEYQNKYGRTTWAKIVKNEFKAKHDRREVGEIKEKKIIESAIVEKYVTLSLIEKEKAKIEAEDGWTSKCIPRLLNTVYYCLVAEECWNFIKEHKRPVIDFKALHKYTVAKIQEEMPDIF